MSRQEVEERETAPTGGLSLGECRASTSRGISHSSGDYEGSCSDHGCSHRRQMPCAIGAVSSNVCRSRRSGRHARVPFTATQAAALEAAYARAPYLAPPALRALAAALQLRDDRIKIWFQNRRARERREKCTIIAPPRAVTLPATRLPAPNSWSPPNQIPDLTHDIFMINAQSCLEVENTHELSEESRGSEDTDYPLDVETVDE